MCAWDGWKAPKDQEPAPKFQVIRVRGTDVWRRPNGEKDRQFQVIRVRGADVRALDTLHAGALVSGHTCAWGGW